MVHKTPVIPCFFEIRDEAEIVAEEEDGNVVEVVWGREAEVRELMLEFVGEVSDVQAPQVGPEAVRPLSRVR